MKKKIQMLFVAGCLTVAGPALSSDKTGHSFRTLDQYPVKDSVLVSQLKKESDSTLFYPQPIGCDTGRLALLQGVGNKKGDSLALSFIIEPSTLEGDWKVWQSKIEAAVKNKFSSLQERASVGDKLLVVQARFDVDQNGRIGNLDLSPWCPSEFQSMILETLKTVQESSGLTFPEAKKSMRVNGRFSQNYGPRFIEKREAGQSPASPKSI
ncbi:MAG: hypothetical protein AB7M93_30545 [Candidatus Obscuribacterales bacterium]